MEENKDINLDSQLNEEDFKDIDLTPDLEPQLTEEDLKDTYYEGEFVDGLKHGHGIQHNGPNYYESEYINGQAIGKATAVNFFENLFNK